MRQPPPRCAPTSQARMSHLPRRRCQRQLCSMADLCRDRAPAGGRGTPRTVPGRPSDETTDPDGTDRVGRIGRAVPVVAPEHEHEHQRPERPADRVGPGHDPRPSRPGVRPGGRGFPAADPWAHAETGGTGHPVGTDDRSCAPHLGRDRHGTLLRAGHRPGPERPTRPRAAPPRLWPVPRTPRRPPSNRSSPPTGTPTGASASAGP